MQEHRIPKWSLAFFRWYCHPDYLEDLEGDIHERFERNYTQNGRSFARRHYTFDVLKLFRPGIIHIKVKTQFNNTMRHHFIIGYRTLLRDKVYSFLNIGGLAMGMTIAILVGLWIHDELTYNDVHIHKDRIIQVMRLNEWEGETYVNQSLPGKLGPVIKDQFQDLFDQVVIIRGRIEERALTNHSQKFSEKGYFIQNGGPSMLSLDMINGSEKGLKEINSILLSESLAMKLFNGQNPVGQSVRMDSQTDLQVSGVYRDLPRNSTFHQASFFISLERYHHGIPSLFAWDNYNMWIYGKLAEGKTAQDATESIRHLMKGHTGDREHPVLMAHPMTDWHLRSAFKNGVPVLSETMKFIILYGLVGSFVLILACINFINLSTARSEKRAKEVGIRKTFGSVRSELIQQFLTESFLYVFFSFVLALIGSWLLLDWFNDISDKHLVMPFNRPIFWLAGFGLTTLTAFVSGCYPAFYLSRFRPVSVLKRKIRVGKSSIFSRRTLVVFQFTISITLIITSLVVRNQVEYVKSRPVGYNQEGLLTMRVNSPEFVGRYELLRQELKSTGKVLEIAEANYPLTTTLGNMDDFIWEGQPEGFDPTFNMVVVTHDYGDAIGWELVAGRNFSREYASDLKGGVIINESAQKIMGFKHPIGKTFTSKGGYAGFKRFHIVGVVKDLVKGSPFEPAKESIHILREPDFNNLFIRINPQVSTSDALVSISEKFEELFPNTPFHYEFVDDVYANKFATEERVGKLSGFFTILACFISCLGLLGLAAYSAERRTKEIGIRKVLGATVFSLWKLMSREYSWLVLISLLIACPIAYYLMTGWLESYTFKTSLSWSVFALAGMGVLGITLITVSSQAIKAAVRNPVEVLRYE